MAFKQKGFPMHSTKSALKQKKEETKRGEDPNKHRGTGLVKELTPKEKLERQEKLKKVDRPKRISGVDNRTTEQIREDKKPKRGENPHPNKGTGLVE